MSRYPNFVEVRTRRYKINTDYETALECEKIAKSDISEEERAMAIIYILYSEEGLNNTEDWEELLQLALKYLNCGKESKNNNEKPNMSFEQDRSYIEASFFNDYKIDLEDIKMHWWKFYELLEGLTEDCVLNRVRFVRDFDISQIKDRKEKEKWLKQKAQVALKREKTVEEKRLDELFEKQINGG